MFSRKKTPSPLNVLNKIKITNPYYAQTQTIRTSLKKRLQNGTITRKEAQKIIQDHLNFVKNQQTRTYQNAKLKSRKQAPKRTAKSKTSESPESMESLFDNGSPIGYLQLPLENVNIGIYTHAGTNVPIQFLKVPNNAKLTQAQIQQKINQYNTFKRIVPVLNTAYANNKLCLINAGMFLRKETVKNINNTPQELIQLTIARTQLLQIIHKKLTSLEDKIKNLEFRMGRGTNTKKKKKTAVRKQKKKKAKRTRRV